MSATKPVVGGSVTMESITSRPRAVYLVVRGPKGGQVAGVWLDEPAVHALAGDLARALGGPPPEAKVSVSGSAINPARPYNDPWPCTCGHARYAHEVPTPERCLVCPCGAWAPAEDLAKEDPI